MVADFLRMFFIPWSGFKDRCRNHDMIAVTDLNGFSRSAAQQR